MPRSNSPVPATLTSRILRSTLERTTVSILVAMLSLGATSVRLLSGVPSSTFVVRSNAFVDGTLEKFKRHAVKPFRGSRSKPGKIKDLTLIRIGGPVNGVERANDPINDIAPVSHEPRNLCDLRIASSNISRGPPFA